MSATMTEPTRDEASLLIDRLASYKKEEPPDRLILMYRCTRCGVSPGEPCLTPRGKPYVRHDRFGNSGIVEYWRNELTHGMPSHVRLVLQEAWASELYRVLDRNGLLDDLPASVRKRRRS